MDKHTDRIVRALITAGCYHLVLALSDKPIQPGTYALAVLSALTALILMSEN